MKLLKTFNDNLVAIDANFRSLKQSLFLILFLTALFKTTAPVRADDGFCPEEIFYSQTASPALSATLSQLGRDGSNFMNDHVVLGKIIVPGAAYIDLFLGAAKKFAINNRTSSGILLKNLAIAKPIEISSPENTTTFVYTNLVYSHRKKHIFQGNISFLNSVQLSENEQKSDLATILEEGSIQKNQPPFTVLAVSSPSFQNRVRIDIPQFYENLKASGLSYGPRFRLMTKSELFLDSNFVKSTVTIPDYIRNNSSYSISPEVLDASFHGVASLINHLKSSSDQGGDSSNYLYIPLSFENVWFDTEFKLSESEEVFVNTQLHHSSSSSPTTIEFSLDILGPNQKIMMQIRNAILIRMRLNGNP